MRLQIFLKKKVYLKTHLCWYYGVLYSHVNKCTTQQFHQTLSQESPGTLHRHYYCFECKLAVNGASCVRPHALPDLRGTLFPLLAFHLPRDSSSSPALCVDARHVFWVVVARLWPQYQLHL